MSRFVTPRVKDRAVFATVQHSEPATDKLARIAKYVPSEVLALYLSLNGLAATATGHSKRLLWYGIAFAVCWISTPFYFGVIAKAADPKRYQQAVSTIAFAVWAYALGAGFFTEWGAYDPIGAAFAVALFSFITAFLVPAAPTGDGENRKLEGVPDTASSSEKA